MKIRKLLLGFTIFIIATGFFLFATGIFRETRSTGFSDSLGGLFPPHEFSYIGATFAPDNPPQVTIGTTGIGDLIVLQTPIRDFSNYLCHQPAVSQQFPNGIADCASIWGGTGFNITSLESYLQTHKSQIGLSQTIVDQNMTLAYHVNSPTDVTIVLANLGATKSEQFLQSIVTDQIVTYPLTGYTEHSGTIWSLSNISIGLVLSGTITLIVTLTQFKPDSLLRSRLYEGSAMQRCARCGNQNLFFAGKCRHCGNILSNETQKASARPHLN